MNEEEEQPKEMPEQEKLWAMHIEVAIKSPEGVTHHFMAQMDDADLDKLGERAVEEITEGIPRQVEIAREMTQQMLRLAEMEDAGHRALLEDGPPEAEPYEPKGYL